MCGIAGLVTISGEPPGGGRLLRRAQAMADTLEHRGPDDAGSWESPDGVAALAHRRLSIVDLSPLGRNPMLWDNGRLAITYNGEIYNFLELRRELERDGVTFRSHTDTEVILALYDRWGLDCLNHFVGMFAFGLWDSPRRRLWLVRDRLGKKPLYYSTRNGRLSFASELKGLLADEHLPRAIDADALRMYLRVRLRAGAAYDLPARAEARTGSLPVERGRAALGPALLGPAEIRRVALRNHRDRSGARARVAVDDGRPPAVDRGRPARRLPLRRGSTRRSSSHS